MKNQSNPNAEDFSSESSENTSESSENNVYINRTDYADDGQFISYLDSLRGIDLNLLHVEEVDFTNEDSFNSFINILNESEISSVEIASISHGDLEDIQLSTRLERIANALENNSSIRSFTFNEGSIGVEGITRLLRAAINNGRLESISLNQNLPDDMYEMVDTAELNTTIIELLSRNTTITEISLRQNGIGDATATSIISALSNNYHGPNISLDFNGNSLSDDQAMYLVGFFLNNNLISSLDIGTPYFFYSNQPKRSEVENILTGDDSLTQENKIENFIDEWKRNLEVEEVAERTLVYGQDRTISIGTNGDISEINDHNESDSEEKQEPKTIFLPNNKRRRLDDKDDENTRGPS